MVCSKCGNAWNENYCPVCGQSISKRSDGDEDKKPKSDPPIQSPVRPGSKRGLSSLLSVKTVDSSGIDKEAYRKAVQKDFIIGGIALFLGILITAFTLLFYSIGGGFYIITWGAVLYGIIRIFRGARLIQKI